MVGKAQVRLSDAFESWGLVVARRPWLVLWGSMALAIACAAGILGMQTTSASVDLWAIRGKAFRDWEYMDDCCGGNPSSMLVYADRVGTGSIFDRAAILELLKVYNFTTSALTITMADGQPGTYADVCAKPPLESGCLSSRPSSSLLGIWDFDPANVPATDAAVLAMVDALHQVSTVQSFAADPKVAVDSSGVEHVMSSRGMVLSFSVHEDESGNYKTFEEAFNDLESGVSTIADPTIVRVTHFSNHGLDLESGRVVSNDIPMFVVALNLVVVFLGLTLGRTRAHLGGRLRCPHLVEGRYLLAQGGFLTVCLASAAGFGVAAVCGATFHSVVSLLPLIVLGVQVDDCVITVNQLSLVEPPSWPSSSSPSSASDSGANSGGAIAERFATSLRESGPCITTTSLTTVVAFAVGTSAALPGVSYFCMYATAVFFFGWLFQVTFFYACVVLDERRIARRGCCAVPCITVDERNSGGAAVASASASVSASASAAPPAPNGFQRAMHDYSRVLLHPATSLIVVILFGGAVVAAAAVIPSLPVGLALEDILPDDSYVRDAFEVEDTVFKGQNNMVKSVVMGVDFEDAAVRAAFREAVARVGNLSIIVTTYPHWMEAYDGWRDATGRKSEPTYLGGLSDFLQTAGLTVWQDHVKCASAACMAVASARFDVLVNGKPEAVTIEHLEVRRAISEELRAAGFAAEEAIVSSPSFMFAETDQQTVVAILSSISAALVGVLAVMCLSTSPVVALWVTLCVAMIDADLLLVVYLWGMQLNSISYTCLVMACGLAVDYCVHIGHAFDHALRVNPEISLQEAASTAMVRMGASVLQGGFTTFLGTLVIALASSVAFRTFFRFIFATVLLGIAHGMVLLPVLLGRLTPRCLTPAAGVASGSTDASGGIAAKSVTTSEAHAMG